MFIEVFIGHRLELLDVKLAVVEGRLVLKLLHFPVLKEEGTFLSFHQVGSIPYLFTSLAGSHLVIRNLIDLGSFLEHVMIGSGIWNPVASSLQVKVDCTSALLAVHFALFEFVQSRVELASFVVETTFSEGSGAFDTFDDSLPLVLFATLAEHTSLIGFDTTEEFACLVVSVHVKRVTNFASWDVGRGQALWEALLHHLVEWTADFSSSWWAGIHWNFLAVLDPFLILESVPVAIGILVGIAIIMPVASVPFPSALGETFFGWSPIVPSIIVVLVPYFLFAVPFPDVLWSSVTLAAPIAHFWMFLMLLDKLHTFLLSGNDVSVLFIDFLFCLAIVLFVRALNISTFLLNRRIR